MSSREIQEQIAFDEIEPDPAWTQAALVACMVGNAWRGKGQRPYRIADFMPHQNQARTTQTAAEQEAILRAFAASHNANLR